MPRIPLVDKEECTGCGLCEEICPEVFQLNEDNISEAYDADGASEDIIQEAIDGCPVECIHWEEN